MGKLYEFFDGKTITLPSRSNSSGEIVPVNIQTSHIVSIQPSSCQIPIKLTQKQMTFAYTIQLSTGEGLTVFSTNNFESMLDDIWNTTPDYMSEEDSDNSEYEDEEGDEEEEEEEEGKEEGELDK